jgi:hypothetical protein
MRDIEASLIERIRRMLREGQGDQMIKDGMGLTSGACCLAHNVPGEDDLSDGGFSPELGSAPYFGTSLNRAHQRP